MPKMTREQRAIVRAEKSILRDMCIPWDFEFEKKFVKDCTMYPNIDPARLLNKIVHDAKYNDDQLAEDYYKLLRKYHPHAEAVYESSIIDICGREGLEKLKRCNYIECCGTLYGSKIYAI